MCLMYNETHNLVLVKRKRHNILCFVCKCFIYEEITFKSNLTQKFNSYYQLIVIFLENVLSKWKISNDVNTTYSDFYTFNPYKLLFSQI
ncbi:ribonucleoside-diphosphate reductase [Staphylococcus aureus]|nr:ribonucleoside-diphosphate reductase [Staphylococcus aureus]REA90219.1 ribonucleoside-diphosphate reductase [Staphylococcus aureus]